MQSDRKGVLINTPRLCEILRSPYFIIALPLIFNDFQFDSQAFSGTNVERKKPVLQFEHETMCGLHFSPFLISHTACFEQWQLRVQHLCIRLSFDNLSPIFRLLFFL